MKQYITASLELHLYFCRIMKEHALFLLAGFPASETEYKKKADWFRDEFEKVLERIVELSDGIMREEVLNSGEVVTEFTEHAECQTRNLTEIPINMQITRAQKKLRSGCLTVWNREQLFEVRRLNQRVLWLLNGLISFKEKILCEVGSCSLYTANYPLLIEHILREARLYRQLLTELERRGCMPVQSRKETEVFWNQIMMEHAQFIRGLLDPKEGELMETADDFAEEYAALLEEARNQDCRASEELFLKTRKTTEEYRDFKTAGTKGILGCEIRSIILPLLADHVLREANHFLRLLDDTEKVRG